MKKQGAEIHLMGNLKSKFAALASRRPVGSAAKQMMPRKNGGGSASGPKAGKDGKPPAKDRHRT